MTRLDPGEDRPAVPEPVGEPLPLWRASNLAGLASFAHGFSGRLGGASQGPYASLNLSTRVGDDRSHVLINRQRLLLALGRSQGHFVALKQVHGDSVVEVTAGAGPNIAADAVLTRDRGVVLAILVADCLPVLLADCHGRAVAAVHAGWRGTLARVVSTAVKRLHALGIEPKDLRIAMGPAIGPCCFELGGDVAGSLAAAYPGTEAVQPRRDRFVADLWELNRQALLEAGVHVEAIEILRVCTACDARLFSFRRDKQITGRQAGLIALPPKN